MQKRAPLNRRQFFTNLIAGAALAQIVRAQTAQPSGEVFLERSAAGTPHKGKVLLALQAHSDDIPLSAAGTVAKLIQEGYTGYLVRATNDDMGDAPGLGTPGSIGENVLGNERDNAALVGILGLKGNFDLNYNNHYMAGVPLNELMCRLIFLIRLLKVDTVICWDPWAHDEENPDHYMLARAVEAACWIAGRKHDFPEHLAAGLSPHAVQEKYYYARRPEITRVVDISGVVDKKVEANRANLAKGPAGTNGSRLRSKLAKRNLRLPLLGDDDVTADRNYIKEFILARNRELGRKYGVEYAEAFHHIGPGTAGTSRLEEYIKQHAVPLK
ncbi:MAG: PIG-L family deacetylase [Verrucomicrobiales bacterium]|nr:PIG-L family deacetylase [Verrucomicrobiales bacterium]